MRATILTIFILLLQLSCKNQGRSQKQSQNPPQEETAELFEGDSINGAFTVRYPNGNIKTTGFYWLAEPDSIWKSYSEQAQKLKRILIYRKGQKVSRQFFNYHPNGALAEDRTVELDTIPGNTKMFNEKTTWFFYSETGIPEAEMRQINNQDVGSKYWDHQGNEITYAEHELRIRKRRFSKKMKEVKKH